MYFKSLQVLRGLAAVAVVLYHLQHYIALPNVGNDADTLFRFFGVQFSYGAWFFFTLSGFLMAHLVDTGYKSFLARRMLRIYPTYFVAVAVVFLVKTLLFESVNSPNLWRCMTLLPFGATADGRPMAYPLAVEWTLVFEVFFYLVCALFATKFTKNGFLPFLLLWGGVIVSNTLGLLPIAGISEAESGFLPSWKHIGLSNMNLLFISGGLTYYAYKGVTAPSRLLYWSCGIVGPIAFALAQMPAAGAWTPLLLGCSFSFLMLTLCVWEREAKPSRQTSGVLWRLGDYSYAIYLVHVPVMTCMMVGLQSLLKAPLGTGWGMVVLTVSLAVGWHFGKFDMALHGLLRKRLEGWMSAGKVERHEPVAKRIGRVPAMAGASR